MDGDVFDKDLFIDEVEKRPALWDSHVYTVAVISTRAKLDPTLAMCTVAVISTRAKRAFNAPHLNLA
jgi:hypothetical protein